MFANYLIFAWKECFGKNIFKKKIMGALMDEIHKWLRMRCSRVSVKLPGLFSGLFSFELPEKLSYLLLKVPFRTVVCKCGVG